MLPLLALHPPPTSLQETSRIVVMENKRQQLRSLAQLTKIAVLLLLFLLAPFVPSSLKAPYLYLLFNALVLALGVDSGFLAAICGLHDEKKPLPLPSTNVTAPRNLVKQSYSHAVVANAHLVSSNTSTAVTATTPAKPNLPNLKEVNKLVAALPKSVSATMTKKKIKKFPSRANIFVIGSVDAEAVKDTTIYGENEEGRKSAVDLMSKQELFMKAEEFISNFYKQLKMQREEESRKKLQGLYYHPHCKAKPCSR